MAREVTKADVTRAREAIAEMSECEQKLAEAKAMGLDVQEEEERCQHMKRAFLAFNEIHGPKFQGRK